MSANAIEKNELLTLLDASAEENMIREVAQRVRDDPRETFDTSTTRASTLAESLEIKLGIAQRRQRPIAGDQPLMSRLRSLQDKPVSVIGFDGSDVAFGVYLIPGELIVGVLRFDRISMPSDPPAAPSRHR